MRRHEFADEFYRKQRCDGGPRTANQISCVVIHDTEGITARGGAVTLTTRTDAATQLVCDDASTFRIVPELVVPCGVRDVNSWTLHIEQAGLAGWSGRQWLARVKTLQRAAYWTAWWMKKYGIPNRYLTTAGLDGGKRRGWTTHANLSYSKISSSTHTDPGKNWPRVKFQALVAFYLTEQRLFGGPKPKAV